MSRNAFNSCEAELNKAEEQRGIHCAELNQLKEEKAVKPENMLEHLELQTQQTTTQMTVIERARMAVGSAKHEAKLIDLAEGSKAIVSITNADGYKEAHATRMTLKNARLSITKTSKTARDDATAFAKSVIEEERRLIAIIEPDEERINALQVAWDAEIEAEKQSKIAAESARVAAIKEKIEAFRGAPLAVLGKTSGEIRTALDDVDAVQIDKSYGEHMAYAAMVKGDAQKALAGMLMNALEAEAEQERIVKEREELALLREQQRQADVLRAEEERQRAASESERLRKEREEANRKEYAAREALRVQQEESARLSSEIAALRKAEEDRIAAVKKAEAYRIATEQKEEIARANQLAQAAAESENEARINASIPVLVEVSEPADPECDIDRPSDAEILEVLADHFDVSTATAFGWVTAIATFQPAAERLAA